VRRSIAERLSIDQRGSSPDTCDHGEPLFSPNNQIWHHGISTLNTGTSGSREKSSEVFSCSKKKPFHERACKKNKKGLIWIDHANLSRVCQFDESCVHGWRLTVASDIVGEFDAPFPIFKFVKDLMKKV